MHTYAVTDGNHPCFGELALMYAKPRAATVKCASAGLLWGLDRAGFRTVQQHSAGNDATRVLRSVALLSPLRFDQLQAVRDHMADATFEAGTVIAAKGAAADSFIIVLRGTAQIIEGAPPPEAEAAAAAALAAVAAAAGADDDDDEGGDGAGGGPVVIEDSGSVGGRGAAPRSGLSCAGGTGGQCAPFDGQPGKSSSGAVRARSRAAHSVPHDERADASLIQAASAGAVPRTIFSPK